MPAFLIKTSSLCHCRIAGWWDLQDPGKLSFVFPSESRSRPEHAPTAFGDLFAARIRSCESAFNSQPPEVKLPFERYCQSLMQCQSLHVLRFAKWEIPVSSGPVFSNTQDRHWIAKNKSENCTRRGL
jgi:hypothetical protein